MKEEFENILNGCKSAAVSNPAWIKFRELAIAQLACFGRHTITNLITTSGKQFVDWSSTYKIFSKGKIDISKLFEVAITSTIEELPDDSAIVVSMDDTILKKTGKHIPGTAYRRDPLGPKFQTNLIWGQRFLQISMSLPSTEGICQSRAIPIDFHHCPTVKRPNKSADSSIQQSYLETQKKLKLSRQGHLRLNHLRKYLDAQGYSQKQIIAGVDGSYTNKEVLKNLPERLTLIGRIRKDTKLYEQPVVNTSRGRKRLYGNVLPTPEAIRQSDDYKWVQVKAHAAGKVHSFDLKILKDVKWRAAGAKHNLQLVVIRPLGYRLTKNSKILYRDPAYLICTDNSLNIEKLLQSYLWRWEIEVNFREEKNLLGCGEAQVRNPKSIESVPGFVASVYSFLLLASHRANKNNENILPRPSWYERKPGKRITTGDMINSLRTELWCDYTGNNFYDFVDIQNNMKSHKNYDTSLNGAIFYPRK